ncbi:MAG: helix-turn-helix domain-containing protein [Acidimicrobiales bacterium]
MEVAVKEPLTDDLVIVPADDEIEGLRELADALEVASKVFVRCDDGDDLQLSPSAREGLMRLVSYLAADVALAMKPYDEVLTTQEAADLLGMSRPYLVQLLETEAIRIPVQRVGPRAGGHRRIRLRDVLAYRVARDAENDARIDRSNEAGSAESADPSLSVEPSQSF